VAVVLLVGCGDDDAPPAPDCPALADCRDEGRCTAEQDRCVAASDADCRQRSEVCARTGKCTATGGTCIATTDEDCKASSWCAVYGGCHAQQGRCLALSDADCQSSSGCKQYGWCTVNMQGECVKVGP